MEESGEEGDGSFFCSWPWRAASFDEYIFIAHGGSLKNGERGRVSSLMIVILPQRARDRREMTVLVVLGFCLRSDLGDRTKRRTKAEERLTEERIVERNRVDVAHVRIAQKVRINVEEDGHVDRLAGIQPLLFKAKALNL